MIKYKEYLLIIYMSISILEHHGGIKPKEYHSCYLPNNNNKINIFYYCTNIDNLVLFCHSLLFHKVENIYCLIDDSSINIELIQNTHPIVKFIKNNINIPDFIMNNIINEKINHIFWIHLKDNTIVHPNFWSILEIAKQGSNYIYNDIENNKNILYSCDKNGLNSSFNEVNIVASYSNYLEEKYLINELVSSDIQRLSSMELSEITIDVSNSFTPLCHLGNKYMTDKTPYNLFCHRHPYTVIYDMFLRKYKRKTNLKLGEVGVLNGSSLRMWREYFPTASLHGFDIDDKVFKKLQDIIDIKCYKMDASNIHELKTNLYKSVSDGKKFDILIEDASHTLNHQLLFLRYCLDYVESGGIVIIEDIFRAIPVNRFQEVYLKIYDKIENAVLIKPEHKYRFSPGWENDRMLIIWKA